MAPFIATVKSVLSGDTLILTSPTNSSLERTFSLAYVTAPRLNKDGDEPFAFQSREFLRNLTVGKQIKCTVLCRCFDSFPMFHTLHPTS
jgi:staphylococcal nuclease domain-containing protein 1